MRNPSAVRVILTGESGCGKTRVCGAVADGLRDRGWRVVGVISPGVWEGDRKVAIDVLDLRTGETRRLAERADAGCEAGGPATQGWCFQAASVAWCNSLLANVSDADALVVDELGPLELEQGQGLTQGMQAVDAGLFRLALVVVRPRLLEVARACWPGAQVLAVHDATRISGVVDRVLDLAQTATPPGRLSSPPRKPPDDAGPSR